MKKYVVLLVLLVATATWAAVSMTITVPTAAVSTVLEAFNLMAGQEITIEVRNEDPNKPDGKWVYSYEPKDPNESQLEFSERVTKEHIRAMVRLVDAAKKLKKYKEDISDVVRDDVNVPDEIIE